MPASNLFVGIKLFAKDLASTQIDKTKGSLKRLGTNGIQFATKWAKRMAVVFAVTLVAAMVSATRAAAKFQTTMAEVATLLGTDASDAVAMLSTQILQLSQVLPKDANDLGAGLYQVFSSGVSDAAEAMSVLEVAAKAAIGGLTDTFSSVDAITTVINSFQQDTSKATEIADIMFETVKQGKITYSQLATEIGVVANSAALAGVSFEEVSAAIATMTKGGIQASETTTSLNRLLLSIISPQAGAAAAAKRLGIDWSVAGLRARGFQGLLQDLNEATLGNVEALQSVVPDIRSFKAAAVIAGTGAAEYVEQVDNMRNATGASQEAFETMNATFDSTVQLFKNQLNKVLIEMGSELLPTLGEAVKEMTGELTDFSTWISQNKTELARLAESVGSIGKAFVSTVENVVIASAKIADFFLVLSRSLKENLFDANIGSLKAALGAVENDAMRIGRLLNNNAERRLALEEEIDDLRGRFRFIPRPIQDRLDLLEAERDALAEVNKLGLERLTQLAEDAAVADVPNVDILPDDVTAAGGQITLRPAKLKIDEDQFQRLFDEAMLTIDLEARGVQFDLVGIREAMEKIQDLEAFRDLSTDADQLAIRTELLEGAQKRLLGRVTSLAQAMRLSGLSMEQMGPVMFELAELARRLGVEFEGAGNTIGTQIGEALASLTDLKRVLSDIVVGFVRDFGSAIETAFRAMVDGSKSAGKALEGAMLGALASVARGFGEMFLALATAAFASIFGVPPNPAGAIAAAKYTAAATAMFALSGVLGAASSGGGSGGSGGAFGSDNTLAGSTADAGELTVVIKTAAANDPEFLRTLTEALEQISGRKVIARPRR